MPPPFVTTHRSGNRSGPRAWEPLLRLLLIALGAWLTGCTAGHASSTQAASSDARTFQRIVNDLASPRMQGRGVGSEGLDLARDYIADEFKTLGLTPAFLAPDGTPRYTQPFQIDLGVRARQQELKLLQPRQTSFEPNQDFSALGFSAQGSFEGEAVFVGYGIVAPEHGYDNYAHLPPEGLRGRVAIAFRYEPMDADGRSLWAGKDGHTGRWTDAATLANKARWAAQHGAVALLVVNPPRYDAGGPLRSAASTALGDASPIPVLHIRGSTFRAILKAAQRNPAAALQAYQERCDQGQDQPDALEGVVLAGSVQLEHPRAAAHNVAGLIPGSGALRDQLIVIGAHYDHLGYGQIGSLADSPALHPGADDNASGVAGLILIAQHLQQQRAASAPNADRRTLLLVTFSGEERGLLGSHYFVEHPGEVATPPGSRIVAMINLDMIGRLRQGELLVMGADTSDRWRPLLDEARSKLKLSLAMRSSGSGLGMSDHTHFYLQDIPVLHLFTGMHPDYHRPSDTADKINATGGAVIARIAAQVAQRLLTDPQPPRFTPVESESDPHAAAGPLHQGEAMLGILPDYATLDGRQGAEVAGVIPGSPAQHAGLQQGDLIIGWAGRPVRNVRDLTQHLADSQPGQRIELRLRRGSQEITLQVTLGQR
ncbi:MAG TPA: M28 family peptidase [Phycisphaeraceae bacterium]